MKWALWLAFTAIVLIFLSGFAAASLEIATADLTIPVNYKTLDDDDDELAVSRTITIKNNGNSSENISLSLEALTSGYGLSVSPSTLTLEASGNSGASKEITIAGKIPVNVDQGSREIGTLKIKGASEGELNFKLKTEVEPMLKVKEINVYVNGNKERSVDEDDEEVKDLQPGDEIELRFNLKNYFDSDYDEGTIDGDILIELDDSGFGEDIDEENSFEIDAGDEAEIILKFRIPDDAEEDDYSLNIKVEGKDDNKAKYTTEWDLILKVEREEDDVRIDRISLSPEEVSCIRQSQMTVSVINLGSNMQRHAALSIVNNQLGILMDYQFELERGAGEDNSITKQLSLDVSKDIKPGTYPITATVYYDYDVPSDKKVVNLKVKECAAPAAAPAKTGPVAEKDQLSAQKTETTSDETAVNEKTSQKAGEATQISSSKIVKTIEDPYTKDDYLIALLIVAIVVVLVLIVLFLLALLS